MDVFQLLGVVPHVVVHTPKADVQYTRQIDQTTEIIGKNAIGLSG